MGGLRTGFLAVTPLVPAGPDLAGALDFYTRRLGFELVWEGGGMAGVRRGAVEFNLVQNGNRQWADNASFSIAVPDLQALYREYEDVEAREPCCKSSQPGRRREETSTPL